MGLGTWHIFITGLVQGIGFRPFIYNAAASFSLSGWVENKNDGVHIEITGVQDVVEQFYKHVLDRPPKLACVTSSQMYQVDLRDYKTFEILQEEDLSTAQLHVTPDYATCTTCLSEMSDPEDRRFGYPFITCCECGPRYSIVHQLPYDRARTIMDDFTMCWSCQKEYDTPSNRRFYAQVNSCQFCGVEMSLYNKDKEPIQLEGDSIIGFVNSQWRNGKIVAIKGIGGYLLTCAASDDDVVATLRERKNRPDKPFALMYPNLTALRPYSLSDEQLAAFSDPIAPILLLDRVTSESHKGVCDGLDRVGVMLPYTPLFHLLLENYDQPIIATSGNVSNDPIVYDDQQAIDELVKIADFILVNNRKILVPQDDSIVVFSKEHRCRVVLRRSRGMAPSYFQNMLKSGDQKVLAMGADLKSAFAMRQGEQIYISQYLGDLDNYNTQENYKHTLDHLFHLLDFSPKQIVIDNHPNYTSAIKGSLLAEELDIPILKVQHHIAHFSALLGEHALIDFDHKILGVIWDGAGLGDDDNIWGGEFFTYKDYQFIRCDHLNPYPHIAYDKMAREPRLSALAICHDLPEHRDKLQSKFSKVEWSVYQKLLASKDVLETSSMGRVFDAVASILDICNQQSYEGQAASLLQVHAERWIRQVGYDFKESYYSVETPSEFSISTVVSAIFYDLADSLEVGHIAAKFHVTLVDWVGAVARVEGVSNIGFSGGVFQNTLLIDLIITSLGGDFKLLFHKDLSPNDENISFGQIIYASIAQKHHKESYFKND